MENIFPNAAQFDEMNGYLRRIAESREISALTPDSFVSLQTATRQGKAGLYVTVGDQLIADRSGGSLVFDVVGLDKNTPKAAGRTHTVDLLTHGLAATNIRFSWKQLMFAAENTMPAGKYRFTLVNATVEGTAEYNGTYVFEITQAIPKGGGFRHKNIVWKSSYSQSQVIGNNIEIYNPISAGGGIRETVTVSEYGGEASTDLGVFTANDITVYKESVAGLGKKNYLQRMAYGTGRYRDSFVRQWLNSDGAAVPEEDAETISTWWHPATVFDIVPPSAKLAGFMHGLDPDLVAAVGVTRLITSLAQCDIKDGVTFDTLEDKFYLPSITNVDGFYNGGNSEGSKYPYFTSSSDMVKYADAVANKWWLRSFSTNNYFNYVYMIRDDGSTNANLASSGCGIAVGCSIC